MGQNMCGQDEHLIKLTQFWLGIFPILVQSNMKRSSIIGKLHFTVEFTRKEKNVLASKKLIT